MTWHGTNRYILEDRVKVVISINKYIYKKHIDFPEESKKIRENFIKEGSPFVEKLLRVQEANGDFKAGKKTLFELLNSLEQIKNDGLNNYISDQSFKVFRFLLPAPSKAYEYAQEIYSYANWINDEYHLLERLKGYWGIGSNTEHKSDEHVKEDTKEI